MERVKFVINQTPYVYWDWKLREKNREFLHGIDSDYFEYIAEVNVPYLEGEDKHRPALTIRLAYSQALETLFALLCSTIQAPRCGIGWMLSYKNSELNEMGERISKGKEIYSRFKEGKLTWLLLSRHIHSGLAYEQEKKEWIQEGFGRAWGGFCK